MLIILNNLLYLDKDTTWDSRAINEKPWLTKCQEKRERKLWCVTAWMKVGKQSITVDNVKILRDVKQTRQLTPRTVANFDTSLSLNKKKTTSKLLFKTKLHSWNCNSSTSVTISIVHILSVIQNLRIDRPFLHSLSPCWQTCSVVWHPYLLLCVLDKTKTAEDSVKVF
jgi:hypothetical protein